MKKFIALLIVVMLLIPQTVLGADLSSLNLNMNNATVKYEMSFKFNKPLEILSVLENNGYLGEIADYIDLKSLIEGLAASSVKGEVKLDASEDFRKLKMYCSANENASVIFNENLNFNAGSNTAVWMDMDFSDLTAPKFKMITKSPFIRKYVVMDTSDYGLSGMGLSQLAPMFSKETLGAINKAALNILEKHAKISYANGRYTIKLDDAGFKGYIKDLISYSLTFAGLSADDLTETIQALNYLDKINILGKDGLSMVYILSGTKPSLAETKLHISFNIYDIMKAFEAEIPEFITQKNSFIDLTLYAKEKYSDIGSTKINFPVLTEENTYQPYSYEGYYPEEYEYELPYALWDTSESVIIENDKYYLPLRSLFAENFEESRYSLSYNDGVVLLMGELLPQIELIPSGNEIYVNSTLWNEGNVIIRNNVTYIDAEALSSILGYNLSYLDYSLIDKTYSYGLYRY